MSRASEAVEWDRESSVSLPERLCGDKVHFLVARRYRTILTMFPGEEDRVMTVVTPADVASLAATILVPMPPVPKDDPALETKTFVSNMYGMLNILLSFIHTVCADCSDIFNFLYRLGVGMRSGVLVV